MMAISFRSAVEGRRGFRCASIYDLSGERMRADGQRDRVGEESRFTGWRQTGGVARLTRPALRAALALPRRSDEAIKASRRNNITGCEDEAQRKESGSSVSGKSRRYGCRSVQWGFSILLTIEWRLCQRPKGPFSLPFIASFLER